MDFLKVRLFIKDLIYDLDTVRYLLDYGRLKETVPIIDRILDNVGSFRAGHSGNGLNNIFPEDFWDKRLPANMSFSEMRTSISKYSHAKSPLVEKDLDKIEYRAFVNNVFAWSDENISKLWHEAKSPLRKSAEKRIFYLIGIFAGLSLVIFLGWIFFTRDWGLKGDFYQGTNFGKYLYSGYKKTIDFSNPVQMDSRLPNDNFSTRWEGQLLAPQDGEYTIFAFGDDGVKVFIDGKFLMTGTWYAGEVSDRIFLPQGPHRIILEYFQVGGPAALKLSWAIDGGKNEIIPAKYLRH